MGDDIEQLAAAYRIVDDVTVRPEPHGAILRVDFSGHGFGRHHATPADTAGEMRRVGAEQRSAYHRMNAVGANYDVGFDRATIGEADNGRLFIAFDADAAGVKAKLRCLERRRKHFEQICAMDRKIWCAEFLAKVSAFGA